MDLSIGIISAGSLYRAASNRQSEEVLYFYVALGCALGGVCRFLCVSLVTRYAGDAFPWGTLIVNLIGSFFLGAIFGSGLLANGAEGAQLQAFAGIGYCGGLTTFSAFSLQNYSLLSQNAVGKLSVNILSTVVGCLVAAAGGFALMERWAAG